MTDSDSDRFSESIRWPDGPVCPYCGERERIVPQSSADSVRVRYECATCARHRGYFRKPGGGGSASDAATDEGGDDNDEPERARSRPLVPRFPR